jgi:hypothetical protein
MKSVLVLLCLAIYCNAAAQPSNAQVKADAIGNGSGVISFSFSKNTGTRQWNRSAGNWEYVRGVIVKRKSEYPGINLLVYEDVVYQYTGAGGYSFWKVRVLSNEYEGIPNPTAAEINKFISSDWEKFYGYYYEVITKLWYSPKLEDDPKWTWHSPNSVEFRMKLKFDHIIRAKGIETVETVWLVRFYRDDPKAPWKNLFAVRSQEADDSKIISMQNYTPQQVADYEKQTLKFTMAEQAAQQDKTRLSQQVQVPSFTTARELVRFVHNILRNGDPEKFRAVMLQVMAPGFFVEGSKVQLMPNQEQNLADVIIAAYNNKVTYGQLYCQHPYYNVENWGNSDFKKTISIPSAVENCRSQFIVDRIVVGYHEGRPILKLAIVEYGIYVRQDNQVISYINSFDRRKLCPGD